MNRTERAVHPKVLIDSDYYDYLLLELKKLHIGDKYPSGRVPVPPQGLTGGGGESVGEVLQPQTKLVEHVEPKTPGQISN